MYSVDVETLDLAPDDVHVWVASANDFSDRGLRDEYLDLLSDDERSRLEEFAFAKDGDNYLLGRALIRTTLARYATLTPNELRFSTDRRGRPSLDGAPDLSFSLSRTPGLALLAVTAGRAIGADAENTSRRRAPLKVADEIMSPAERRLLFGLPPSERSAAFYASWTIKEACAKATGLGLALDLRTLVVDADLTASCSAGFVRSVSSAPGRGFRLWSWRPSDTHRAAVCVHPSTAERLNIRYARAFPTSERHIGMRA